MTPLYEALKGRLKTITWTPEMEQAFHNTKSALASATKLAYPSTHGNLYLTTDASNEAIGGVLEQEENGVRRPLAFFRKKLSDTEARYSTFDRELLAIHKGVRQFHHLLEGHPFTIETDHQPIVTAFTKNKDAWLPRQQRQLSAIASYPCTITYRRGHSNAVADALSGNAVNAIQLG